MAILLAWIAALTLSSVDTLLPPQVTPIAELAIPRRLRHAEVIQIERDFGRSDVNVALDAWIPAHDPTRIEGVRLWWSDEVDRYPFSDRLRRRVAIRYEQVRRDRWRVTVGGEGQRVVFDVALHEGRPALFADVMVRGNRVVRQCRADAALLKARRILGIPVGLRSMVLMCTAPDGTRHRGIVRPKAV